MSNQVLDKQINVEFGEFGKAFVKSVEVDSAYLNVAALKAADQDKEDMNNTKFDFGNFGQATIKEVSVQDASVTAAAAARD